VASFERVICIVLDGCGAGAAPDAELFGDVGENEGHTLLNTWNAVGGFHAPNLASLGYLKAAGIEYSMTTPDARFAFGRMRELSIGKDTVTGHWEMMGIHLEKPFPTYPKGFPIPLIREFEKRIGRQTIGNEAASGTEIIARLGQMHVETGCPIVYTSADSVFQIACHEDVVPISELYTMCRTARDLLVEPDNVGRVIARPFVGDKTAGFSRTERRRDFPVEPPLNAVDSIAEALGPVFGIGVIPEVFAGRGFQAVRRTQENAQHYEMLLRALESDSRFIWANFEDFDMLFGHRNDPAGFAKCLEQFDVYLGEIIGKLSDNDLLLLTADHGNDPTTPSTDHSREYVPLAIWCKDLEQSVNLGDLDGFWCLGATVCDALGIGWPRGDSQLPKIYRATSQS
jgi:phosphopentomutase